MVEPTQMCPSSISPLGLFQGIIFNIEKLGWPWSPELLGGPNLKGGTSDHSSYHAYILIFLVGKNVLNNPCCSTGFHSKSKNVAGSHAMHFFKTSGFFLFQNVPYWSCNIPSRIVIIQSIKFYQWYFHCIRFTFLMNCFIIFPTVAMLTETISFSRFHSNHCYGDKFLYHNHVA